MINIKIKHISYKRKINNNGVWLECKQQPHFKQQAIKNSYNRQAMNLKRLVTYKQAKNIYT